MSELLSAIQTLVIPDDACALHVLVNCPDEVCQALMAFHGLSDFQRLAMVGILASRNPSLIVNAAATARARYPSE